MASDTPKFFNIPALLGQYPVQGKRETAVLQNQRVEAISNSVEAQQSSFPSTFAGQFMQSCNNGTNTDQNAGDFYTSTAPDSMSPDWAFGPIDDSSLLGFSEFEFSSQEGQDMNLLLNGAPWDASTFQP